MHKGAFRHAHGHIPYAPVEFCAAAHCHGRTLFAPTPQPPIFTPTGKEAPMSRHIQTQTEWEATMARRIMDQLRGELYLDQR